MASRTPGSCGLSTYRPSNRPLCACVSLINMGQPFKWVQSSLRNWIGYGFDNLVARRRKWRIRRRARDSEIYDVMQRAMDTGELYQTRLDPPPADPRVAHNSTPPEWLWSRSCECGELRIEAQGHL